MTIQRATDGKILRSNSGVILKQPPLIGSYSTILDITGNLQIPNRIFKDGNNNVKQITDAASNIPFIPQISTPTYVYDRDGYFAIPSGCYLVGNKSIDLGDEWTIVFQIQDDETFTNNITHVVCCDAVNTSDRGWGVYMSSAKGVNLIDNDNNYLGVGSFSNRGTSTENWKQTLFITFKNGVVYSALYQHGTYEGIFYDRLLASIITSGFTKFNGKDYPLSINGTYNGKQIGGDARLSFLMIYDKAFDFVINNTSTTDFLGKKYTSPFTYLKRYKSDGNKKLFLSSRYLKNASINSNDEITSIEDEIGEYVVTPINLPKYSNKGFQFGSVQADAKRFDLGSSPYADFNLTNQDFFIGMWVYHTSFSGIVQVYLAKEDNHELSYVFEYYDDKILIILSQDGLTWDVDLRSVNLGMSINNYYYVSGLRHNDNLYLFLNGMLVASQTLSTNYTIKAVSTPTRQGYRTIVTDSYLLGLSDDLLLNIGDSIINPNTWTTKPKKFHPPKRRSLDPRIIQIND